MPIIVPADGPLDARFVPVGEAPGSEEEKRGQPFIGWSGQVMMDGASSGGIPRARMRITNISKVRPPEDEPASWWMNRMAEHCEAMSFEFDAYTEARTLLLIGKWAARAVLGICGPEVAAEGIRSKLTPSIHDYHGSVFTRSEALALQAWARDQGMDVVDDLPPNVHSVAVSLHPAFTNYQPKKPRFRLAIQIAIGRAARLSTMSADATMLIRPGEDTFILGASAGLLESYLQQWEGRDFPVTVDVETPRDKQQEIILCGAGVAKDKILVYNWTAEHAAVMREWFKRPGYIVAHNSLYDLRALAAYNIRPIKHRRILDTIVACSRLQPVDDEVRDYPWLSLAACNARHNPGGFFWKESDRTCQQALFRATYPWCPADRIDEIYNGTDVYNTSQLWECIKPLLQREGML